MAHISKESLKQLDELLLERDLLIVQDIDGVCIPLVKDPLQRKIDKSYVEAVSKLKNEFAVLTCGEHEGYRGVNRIIERAIEDKNIIKQKGLYLPGLAACGIEYQDNYGNTSLPGLTSKEIDFLKEVPIMMKSLMKKELKCLIPWLKDNDLNSQLQLSICDTRFSPAINLNGLFSLVNGDLKLQKGLQVMIENIMNQIILLAKAQGLNDSFHLHISPNLGTDGSKEISKYAKPGDIGTTDIQLIVKGALKQCGLIVLLNKFIYSKKGVAPFGESYNVRSSSGSIDNCIEKIISTVPRSDMPTIVGVGDTVTSYKDCLGVKSLRGGSDRGFLTLIQKLGERYNIKNKVIFVDSSHGEVYRPSIRNGTKGITDSDDYLKFDLIMKGGPDEYIEWFKRLSRLRSNQIK